MPQRKPPSIPPVATTSVPISQPPTEAMVNKLGDGLQAQALSTLQGLQLFAEQRPADEQAQWRKHTKALQALIDDLHTASPSEVSDESSSEAEGMLDPSRAAEFGKTLERLREAAGPDGMSRVALAKRAGLSRNTITNIEAGKTNPVHATLIRLLAVPELGLSHSDIPWRQPTEGDFSSAPNCWIAPGYDPIKMFVDLITLLNGQGGSIEQTYAYLDPKSALNWFGLSNQSSYANVYRESAPLAALAAKVLERTDHGRVDFIALGAGDGKQEVRLLQHLLEQTEAKAKKISPDISLYLLDISQPLLSEALRHANTTLAGRSGVTVWAVQGNFHHLPRYTQLHYAPQRANRRRLVTMFGNTIGNLDSEPAFLRHCLVGFAPGDLLLLDVLTTHAPASSPDEVRKKDPALQGPVRPAHVEWLGGPLLRYANGVVNVQLQYELETRCPVPGSYCLDTIATVKLADGREKQFSIFRFKRYDPQGLIQLLAGLGWESVAQYPYGPNQEKPNMELLLFRRVKPTA